MSAVFGMSGFNLYLQFAVTIISISVHLFNTRNTNRIESVIEIITLYTIGLSGWFGIMSGLFGHIIYADEVASSIGWPLNSGFQMELGFASIGIGLVGFLSFWNHAYWLPFIIVRSVFSWGAGCTHILHMIQHGNFSPSNTGVVVYWDFIWPLVLIILYWLCQREQKQKLT
jgi:hypothetical protein